MTVAPKSASVWLAQGPARPRLRSSTNLPCKAGLSLKGIYLFQSKSPHPNDCDLTEQIHTAQLASALLVVLMNIKKYSTNQYKLTQTL